MFVWVDIAPGRPPTSQGPSLPLGFVDPGGPEGYGLFAWDEDGWISEYRVDWHDGSPIETFSGEGPCRERDSGWPVSRSTIIVSHHYPDDTQEYPSPTVTAISRGCAGDDIQERVLPLSPYREE